MTLPLPPDPYKALGLSSDAEIGAIKSAYRKLVLQCHPDKVQDAELKAIKQDEFQRVQEAYELLSDESRRAQYDEQVKILAWKKELGRNGPAPGKNVFDFEIRTAEPRSPSFKSRPTKVYAQPSPRSYEDDLGPRTVNEELRARARKTASYEERKRPPTREDEKRRRAEEELYQERWEKEARRADQNASKKSRDKERRKRSEEKQSRTTGPYLEEDDESDDMFPPRMEKRSPRRMEDDIRIREESSRESENARRSESVMTPRERKIETHIDSASQYQAAHRRKAELDAAEFRMPRRAETFHVSHVRFSTTDEHSPPRRRRPAEDIPISIPFRSRDLPLSSGKERNGPPRYERDPYIVEAVPDFKKPTLQSYPSAPPVVPSVRKESHRSKASPEYSTREVPPPPLVRSATTMQPGEKVKATSKGSGFIKEYRSDDSESERRYFSGTRSGSPSRRRRDPDAVRFIFDNGRSVPIDHRSELREDNFGYPRDRSESPRGGRRSSERPTVVRQAVSGNNGGSSTHPTYTRGPYFPGNRSPEPIIKEARPKNITRERAGGRFFDDIKFSPNYGPENVKFSDRVKFADSYRRGSDPSHHRQYTYTTRTGKTAAYA